jgi:hypothetical protein
MFISPDMGVLHPENGLSIMKRFVFSFMSLLLAAAVLPVSAQTYMSFRSEMAQILEKAKWRLGPFRIRPLLLIRDIGYDDNIFYAREESGRVSDFTATLSPQVNIHLIYRDRIILSIMENPGYVFFARETKERSLNNTFSPSLRLLLLDRLALTGSYQNRKVRSRATSEFNVRSTVRTEGSGIHLFYETPRGTSIGLSGTRNTFKYEDIILPGEEQPLSLSLNREERRAQLEVYYRVFSLSSLFFTAGYTDYLFLQQASRWRDSNSYQVLSGVQLPLTGRARGMVSLGYKVLRPRRGELKGFSGLIGNSDLSLRVGRLGFRFHYSRDSQFSHWFNNVYFIENLYIPGASLYLTEFLRLDYDYASGRNLYPERALVQNPNGSLEESQRLDRFRTHSFGAVMRIVRDIGIGLMVSLDRRNSNYFYENNRNRSFFGGYVTYEF